MMICKEDLQIWFKSLESYKRIDTMCVLLEMCLPFELRFLGTCLEELGRRDSQELRGIELRVNNSQDLAIDIVACKMGKPTDKKIRRKMALYLALLRTCNVQCLGEIYKTLQQWGELDFASIDDMDTLKELLLVYTLAAKHPAFSYSQHTTFIKIFQMIASNRLLVEKEKEEEEMRKRLEIETLQRHYQQLGVAPETTAAVMQQQLSAQQLEFLQQQQHANLQHFQYAVAPGQQQQPQQMPPPAITQNIIPLTPYTQATQLNKLLPDASIPPPHTHAPPPLHHLSVDGLSQFPPLDPSGQPVVLPNAAWLRHYPAGPPPPLEQHPPPASSPMLSQQSSPSSSRTTSPNRSGQGGQVPPKSLQQQQQHSRRLKNTTRRPSTESTPPPMNVVVQMSNDLILPPQQQQPQSYKHIDELSGNNEMIPNGYARPPHGHGQRSLKGGQSYLSSNAHGGSVPSSFGGAHPGTGSFTLAYNMQNLAISDGSSGGGNPSLDSNKSGAGSDSGSSIASSGEASPSETPTTMLVNASTSTQGNYRLSNEQQTQTDRPAPRMGSSGGGYGSSGGKHNARQNGRSGLEARLSRIGAGGTEGRSVGGSSSESRGNSAAVPDSNQPIYEQMSAGAGSNNNAQITTSSAVANSNSSAAGATSSAATPGGGGSAPVLLPAASTQQFNAPYTPYNTGVAALAAQHITPPLIPAHVGYRLPPPAFPVPPNTEGGNTGAATVIYPPYPANIFLTTSAVPQPPPQTGVLATPVTTMRGSTPTVQSQQPSLSSIMQHSDLVHGSPRLSCYNCGSRNHTGRDCLEMSMDDVTRSSNYKLNYTVVTDASSNPSANATASTSASSSNSLVTVGITVGGASSSGEPTTQKQIGTQSSTATQTSTTTAATGTAVAVGATASGIHTK